MFSYNTASAFCFDEAGKFYNVNPILLKAIAYTESSLNEKAINYNNSNGTVDYGLMQINSFWFPKLEKLGISKEEVINNSCTNVFVGAWVLAQNFESHGEGWLSVGAYNAGFSVKRSKAREKYISLVKKNFNVIKGW